MKRKVNKRQFENMIAECVQEALAESRQPRQNKRKVMNEAQMQRYIQNIINEELENEAVGGFFSGLFGKGRKDASQAMSNMKQNMSGKVDQARQWVGDKAEQAQQWVGDKAEQAQQYGKNLMQAGRNGSAVQDINKVLSEISALQKKYGEIIPPGRKGSLTQAYNGLEELRDAFANGTKNA